MAARKSPFAPAAPQAPTSATVSGPFTPPPPDFSFDPPEDWPRSADGKPLDFEDMTEEQQTFVFDKYKAVDLESWRANHAVQARVEPFMEGKSPITPWYVRDGIKYDACMERVAHLSGTYLYLEQTSPEVKRIQAPNPQQVPTFGALDQWMRENVWDGNQARYSWVLRLGTRQMASGHLNYGRDEMQQLAWSKKMRELRAGVGSPPVAPYVPPPPVPPPPAAAPPPPRAPESSLARDPEVEKLRLTLQEERFNLERQRIEMQHQMAMERQRLEHQAQLQEMNARIGALAHASQGAPSEVNAELAKLRAELNRLSAAPAPATTPPAVVVAPPPPAAPTGIPKPPSNIALPPGFDWHWNYHQEKWELKPLETAAPQQPPAAPQQPPAAPSKVTDELPLLTAARQTARAAEQTQQAVALIGGALGFPIPAGANPFAPPAALASEPAAAKDDDKEEEEKNKKKPLFEDEGGVLIRRDKDGDPILDTEQLGMFDFIANGGKFFELAKMGAEFFREQGQASLADEERKAKIAKEHAEAQKLKAEAELTAAQARERNAQALLTAQRAVGNLPVATEGGGEVSSTEPPS